MRVVGIYDELLSRIEGPTPTPAHWGIGYSAQLVALDTHDTPFRSGTRQPGSRV